MIRLQVSADSEDLEYLFAAVSQAAGAESLAATAAAAAKSAGLLQSVWRNYAGGGNLNGIPSLKNPQGGYARSIRVVRHGPFHYEVVSDSPVAAMLEHGTPAFDMKETHTKGRKSRVSKKGVPYLIVPFRWGEKNGGHFRSIIPEQVLRVVAGRRFKKSSVASGTHIEPNAKGVPVARRGYRWGSRLSAADIAGAGGTIGETERNATGMVSMANGGGRFTFRVISAASPASSWINPGIPARPVAATVAAESLPAIRAYITAALKKDLGV